MKKLLIALALFTSSITFSQNGIESYYSEAKLVNQNEYLYTFFSHYTQKIENFLITEEILDKANLRRLKVGEDYYLQFTVENNRNIMYYITKSNKQATIERREANDSISLVLSPQKW